MLVRLTRHSKALLHLKSSLRLLVLSIVLGPEETTCATRTLWGYMRREITDSYFGGKVLDTFRHRSKPGRRTVLH